MNFKMQKNVDKTEYFLGSLETRKLLKMVGEI